MTRPENPMVPISTAAGSAEARLDAALALKPSPQISADFAAKVAVLALSQPLRPRRARPQIGRTMALILTPLVAIALFALAPHSSPNVKNLIFDTEVILIAQLALIGWWLGAAKDLQPLRWR